MRATAEIDAEIAATSQHLLALQQERAETRQAEIDAVCRDFDMGRSPREIGMRMKIKPAAVCGILYRNGRSVEGRATMREQRVRAATGRHAPGADAVAA